MVGAAEDDERAVRDAMAAASAAMTAASEAVFQAGSAKRKRAEESLEEQKSKYARLCEEAERLRADAVKVKEDADTGAAECWREIAAGRAALDAEKAAMENTYAFQTSIIKLDVGGHKFTTSLPTLTSVPDTYLAALFSGRHPLAPNADGAIFIDRNGTHFGHILSYLRDPGRDETVDTACHVARCHLTHFTQ